MEELNQNNIEEMDDNVKPLVAEVIEAHGEVSDEIDYAVNRYVMAKRGGGLTACDPALVKLEDGKTAIHFKLDQTFLDSETNAIMGYGDVETGTGFVGEVMVLYNEETAQVDMLYITPEETIDDFRERVLDDSSLVPQVRPKGKY